MWKAKAIDRAYASTVVESLLILLAAYGAIGLLTAVGAHRRHGSWWRSFGAGVVPFVAWTSWYVHDTDRTPVWRRRR